MKKIIFALTVIGLAFCLSGPLNAQPAPGSQSNSTPVAGNPIGGPPGGGAPIGGGAGLLVALGLAYGISRLYIVQKQKAVQE